MVFQSTHPKRDETLSDEMDLMERQFQSTHPKRDETGWSTAICWPKRYNFNPLIPSGMRTVFVSPSVSVCTISIHSSQAGWEFDIRWNIIGSINFNPLIPSGMRSSNRQGRIIISIISIHSSQAGWEIDNFYWDCITIYFNPLIPSGMRTTSDVVSPSSILFQSTHPKRDENALDRSTSPFTLFQSTHPKRDENFGW